MPLSGAVGHYDRRVHKLTTLEPYSDEDGNEVVTAATYEKNIRITFRGSNNRVEIAEGCRMDQLHVVFDCDNGTLTIGAQQARQGRPVGDPRRAGRDGLHRQQRLVHGRVHRLRGRGRDGQDRQRRDDREPEPDPCRRRAPDLRHPHRPARQPGHLDHHRQPRLAGARVHCPGRWRDRRRHRHRLSAPWSPARSRTTASRSAAPPASYAATSPGSGRTSPTASRSTSRTRRR